MASTERAPELSDQAVMLAFQLVEYLHISNANVWELVSEEQKNTINFILKNFKNPQVEWAEKAPAFKEALNSFVKQTSSLREHPLYQGYAERERKDREAMPPPPNPEVANLTTQMTQQPSEPSSSEHSLFLDWIEDEPEDVEITEEEKQIVLEAHKYMLQSAWAVNSPGPEPLDYEEDIKWDWRSLCLTGNAYGKLMYMIVQYMRSPRNICYDVIPNESDNSEKMLVPEPLHSESRWED